MWKLLCKLLIIIMVLQKVNRDVFIHWKGIILYLAIKFTDFLYILTIIKMPIIKQKPPREKIPRRLFRIA